MRITKTILAALMAASFSTIGVPVNATESTEVIRARPPKSRHI
ncbi:hypothetical protein CFELI_12915 [Corynebacterium felinum]|uniref:Uncharacterized protein n=1 Tax=Corynebacterium felinum TaxID=131318 RepID=A0ABU2B5U8_9CORY|nr:hypothetical protein [Corynebacterium felinum]MDR7353988.1 hypothetical protein [Corynebacterium felinum]WJY96162.1 hypothetical protein CFELI_12915 [Corynebacterium felinum]